MIRPSTLISIAAPLLFFSGELRAADRPSHMVIPDWSDGSTDPQRAADMLHRLRSALSQESQPPSNGDALQQILDLIQRNDIEGLQKSLQDRRIREQLNSLRPGDPTFQRAIEERARRMERQGQSFDVEQLQKLLRTLQGGDGLLKPPGAGPPTIPADPNAARRVSPPPVTSDQQNVDDPSSRVAPATESRDTQNLPPSERFREWLKRAENWIPERFRRSEAVERFREQIASSPTRSRRELRLPGNLQLRFDWERLFRGSGRWLEKSANRLQMGRLPEVRLPDLGRSPEFPSFGTPSGNVSGLGSFGWIVGLTGTALMTALLLWRLLTSKSRADERDGEGLARPMFDWRTIVTREDFVRAFDHLTVSRVGPSAVHWHHRRRAEQFSKLAAAHPVGVARLADVYELARYAPPQENISEATLAQARGDLLALARIDAP